MIVTWTTFNLTNTSTVEYGINYFEKSSTGNSTLFVDGGDQRRTLYIHRVVMNELKPGQTYCKLCFEFDF